MDNVSDTELLDLLADGNRVAFNQIYERYWKSLYGYTYNILKCSSLTEDVLQDVFLKIWEHRSKRKILDLKPYLYQAVRNNAISKLKKVKFTSGQEIIIANLSSSPKAEDHLNLMDLTCKINQVTDNLPARCREIFNMSRFQQLSSDEISESLGISKQSVDNQISIALKYIRRSLKKAAVCMLLAAIFHFGS